MMESNEEVNLTNLFPDICEKYTRYPVYLSQELYNLFVKNVDEEESTSLISWINTLLHQVFLSYPNFEFVCGGNQVRIIITSLPDKIVLHASVMPISGSDPSPVIRIRKGHQDEIPKSKPFRVRHVGRCPQCLKLTMHAQRGAGGMTRCDCMGCGYIRDGIDVSEGQGVVHIVSVAGGNIHESRKPTNDDIHLYDVLSENDDLESESYITVFSDGKLMSVRGDLP